MKRSLEATGQCETAGMESGREEEEKKLEKSFRTMRLSGDGREWEESCWKWATPTAINKVNKNKLLSSKCKNLK